MYIPGGGGRLGQVVMSVHHRRGGGGGSEHSVLVLGSTYNMQAVRAGQGAGQVLFRTTNHMHAGCPCPRPTLIDFVSIVVSNGMWHTLFSSFHF